MPQPGSWLPPGKNCGLCGEKNCAGFTLMMDLGKKTFADCPYYNEQQPRPDQRRIDKTAYSGLDVLGHPYDFVLAPLPGEISARKIVLPFRSDLVEKMEIKKGDLVLGRPMGAGCPIPHVLRVIKVEYLTGLLYTWVVGPKYSRTGEIKDVTAYHMIGFEGIAKHILKEPTLGCRVTFLPGFCMMALNHTGLLNMALEKSCGLHVRIEDIRILAGRN